MSQLVTNLVTYYRPHPVSIKAVERRAAKSASKASRQMNMQLTDNSLSACSRLPLAPITVGLPVALLTSWKNYYRNINGFMRWIRRRQVKANTSRP